MLPPEEIGNITARLAIADEGFLEAMLVAAKKARDRMLPDDRAHLTAWAREVRILRHYLRSTPKSTPKTTTPAAPGHSL